MRTMVVIFGVLLSVTLAGCATSRAAYYYDHPTKRGYAESAGDFAACRMTTGFSEGKRFDRCMVSKGYTPVYAD